MVDHIFFLLFAFYSGLCVFYVRSMFPFGSDWHLSLAKVFSSLASWNKKNNAGQRKLSSLAWKKGCCCRCKVPEIALSVHFTEFTLEMCSLHLSEIKLRAKYRLVNYSSYSAVYFQKNDQSQSRGSSWMKFLQPFWLQYFDDVILFASQNSFWTENITQKFSHYSFCSEIRASIKLLRASQNIQIDSS